MAVCSGSACKDIPEIEHTHYEASMQELVDYDPNYAIIKASAHGCVWVCHNYPFPAPFCYIIGVVRPQ